jgi:hypothetical protein
MNTYSVEIRGQGFLFAGADGHPLRGFTVTRLLEAADAAEAEAIALARVAAEWAEGEFASTRVQPQLEVGEVTVLQGRALRQARDAGYHFHPGVPPRH